MKSLFAVAVAVVLALRMVPVSVQAQGQDDVSYTISNSCLLATVQVTIDGRTFQVAPNSTASGLCSQNATVVVTALLCRGTDFNIGNGGVWQTYDAGLGVIGARCLGN